MKEELSKQACIETIGSDLHYLHSINGNISLAVYNTLLHCVNTPNITIEQAVEFLSYESDNSPVNYLQDEDNLPF